MEDLHGDVGTLDVAALEQIRSLMLDLDGLVDGSRTGLDSLLDTTRLEVHYADGIGDAGWARFDVTWYRPGHYGFHHVDEGECDFRFDHHPKPAAPTSHFHPPPNAPSDDVQRSCIEVTEPQAVARAVHFLWRRAYDSGDTSRLNHARDPP